MEFLLEGCSCDGTYWLYKEEGDVTVRLMELSSVFGMEDEGEVMSDEEKKQKEITWKWVMVGVLIGRSMTLNMCMHYADLLRRNTPTRNATSTTTSGSTSSTSSPGSTNNGSTSNSRAHSNSSSNRIEQYLLINGIVLVQVGV